MCSFLLQLPVRVLLPDVQFIYVLLQEVLVKSFESHQVPASISSSFFSVKMNNYSVGCQILTASQGHM